MRTVYHQRLTELAGRLGEMCSLAGIAMKRATQALLEADIGAAEQVIRDHERIVAMRAQVEKEAFALLALQHPDRYLDEMPWARMLSLIVLMVCLAGCGGDQLLARHASSVATFQFGGLDPQLSLARAAR